MHQSPESLFATNDTDSEALAEACRVRAADALAQYVLTSRHWSLDSEKLSAIADAVAGKISIAKAASLAGMATQNFSKHVSVYREAKLLFLDRSNVLSKKDFKLYLSMTPDDVMRYRDSAQKLQKALESERAQYESLTNASAILRLAGAYNEYRDSVLKESGSVPLVLDYLESTDSCKEYLGFHARDMVPRVKNILIERLENILGAAAL